MERSISQDIREEREELREAAEQTLNALVDLNLDGTIKWVSPSWSDVVGTPYESVGGTPISDVIISENRNAFIDVIEGMKRDDSKSHRVRVTVLLGPLSKLRAPESYQGDIPSIALEGELEPGQESEQEQNKDQEEGQEQGQEHRQQAAELEAQGIMVYDSVSGGESHVSITTPLPKEHNLIVTDNVDA